MRTDNVEIFKVIQNDYFSRIEESQPSDFFFRWWRLKKGGWRRVKKGGVEEGE